MKPMNHVGIKIKRNIKNGICLHTWNSTNGGKWFLKGVNSPIYSILLGTPSKGASLFFSYVTEQLDFVH